MNETCPYLAQPITARWRDMVSNIPAEQVDPTTEPPLSFKFDRGTAIASAGSCFAQHIKKRLTKHGFNYLITEPGPAGADADELEDLGYGVFPARFGNIYTTPQLLQLFLRCFGSFTPEIDHWFEKDRVFDPFRPLIQPGGFATLGDLRLDRDRHLRATRQMFEQVEVFVFTLGLTEAWRGKHDGSVFPVAPGCGAGTFDPRIHEFANFGIRETVEALGGFVERLRAVNPNVKIILTVSPVPLAATMTKKHVVEANVYSKSVLRVAADEIRSSFDCVSYFPSYEIVTSTGNAGEFFAGDGRTVTSAAVDRVMGLFLHRYADHQAPTKPRQNAPNASTKEKSGVICDEDTMINLMNAARKS